MPSASCAVTHTSHDPYDPLWDSSLTYEERGRVFTNWITSYFAHGDTPGTFERHKRLKTPPSTRTIPMMSKDDFRSTVHVPPGALPRPSCTISTITTCSVASESGRAQSTTPTTVPRREAVKLANTVVGDEWQDVEVRYVWCDNPAA
ncbi:hypothetical protein FKP32DRAFT_1599074 [Trametes sanguinea]|nr:hypothetical protein FKP32DRAFT_1599074 [Trametes sanguinea]